jgi:hypothetical protein
MNQQLISALIEKFTDAIDKTVVDGDGVLHQVEITQVLAETIATIPDAAGPDNARRIADRTRDRLCSVIGPDASQEAQQ